MGNDGSLLQVVQDVAAVPQRKCIPVRSIGSARKQVGHDTAHAATWRLPNHICSTRHILLHHSPSQQVQIVINEQRQCVPS